MFAEPVLHTTIILGTEGVLVLVKESTMNLLLRHLNLKGGDRQECLQK